MRTKKYQDKNDTIEITKEKIAYDSKYGVYKIKYFVDYYINDKYNSWTRIFDSMKEAEKFVCEFLFGVTERKII